MSLRREWLWETGIVVCVGAILWINRPDWGKVEVRFERWQGTFPREYVLSVSNTTRKTVSLEEIQSKRYGLSGRVTRLNKRDWEFKNFYYPTISEETLLLKIAPGTRSEICLVCPWEEDTVDVYLSPWTKAEAAEAATRYAKLPGWIIPFLKRYPKREPGHRHRVEIPRELPPDGFDR